MGVNKSEFIRSILHFSDNHKAIPRGQPGHDRLYKLRPVVEELRSKFKSVALEQKLCVDEQMCATKAKNYLRQYLPKKPHKWGYKIYVLSGVSGFAYDFEIYTGQGNDETLRLPGEPDLGSCANVVVRLTRCVSPQNHQIYFDNFYTSLPLIVHLAKKNIHALGTVRRDRIPGNKLPSETELKEKERGFSAENCVQVDDVEVYCVVWKDNKSVTLLSSFVGIGKQEQVDRFCKKKKVIQKVNCPQVVKSYNQHMGGVDKINSIIGRYKIRMKTRKWYLRLFYHLLDVTMCNSWLLYQRVCRDRGDINIMPLAEFRESVAITMCRLGSNITPKRGRPSTELDVALLTKSKKPHVSALPPKEVRKDQTGHWPIWNNNRLRCKLPDCESRSYVNCSKCNLTLCLNKDKNCFYKFHNQ
ncbi:piggyBac transposable element-derived protein 2-like [Macrosteles quadrilineatus]|uniref:piggyBac transposable element-derived protein 2-like n=1 Tax=Macrosteles quadrilineatus TaxID=74068 RepID=UPI0023E33BD6|nr:piggyBac transposable element-derived protein 2-like [Macrosteles quadrilineatus]